MRYPPPPAPPKPPLPSAGYGAHKHAPRKPQPATTTAPPPKPLTQAETEHAAAMKAGWQEFFPGDPFLKELYEAGMIDGYRNIIDIQPLDAEAGEKENQ